MAARSLRWLLCVGVALSASGFFPFGTHAATLLLQPENRWVNVTGTLANMVSECGNLTMLSAVPGSSTVIAGVAGKGLWTNNGGTAWVQLSGSGSIANRASWIVYDPAHAGVFWESGIYGGGGVYQTTDNGNTFRRLGSIKHNDYVSVDLRDPERQTMLAGGHEQSQTVYQSSDGGRNWMNIGSNLPANSGASTNPLIINESTYVVNALGGAPGSGGIYRTTTAGTSWQKVSGLGPSGPPLVTSNRTIYWPADGGLLRSTDMGATWTLVGKNIQPVHPLELSDGKLVSVGSDYLVISPDRGETWSPFGAPLPFRPNGVIYSPSRRTFLIWHGDCREMVPPDAVMEIH
jgi:hypothetical protein